MCVLRWENKREKTPRVEIGTTSYQISTGSQHGNMRPKNSTSKCPKCIWFPSPHTFFLPLGPHSEVELDNNLLRDDRFLIDNIEIGQREKDIFNIIRAYFIYIIDMSQDCDLIDIVFHIGTICIHKVEALTFDCSEYVYLSMVNFICFEYDYLLLHICIIQRLAQEKKDLVVLQGEI